jgi:hypothetical protein
MKMSLGCRAAGAALCAFLIGTLTADAATVLKQNGSVLINSGSGFVPLASQAELAPGAQVMVQPGGRATITYASNCTVRIGSGVWSVQPVSPCTSGSTEIDFTGRMNQQTLPTPPPGMDPVVVGTAVAVGVGAVGLAIVLSQGDNDKPASP